MNNESCEIIRIFNSAFNHLLPADKAAVDLYPEELRTEIDSINEWMSEMLNSTYLILVILSISKVANLNPFFLSYFTVGVYKAVMAMTQEGYEKAVIAVFDALDRIEKLLEGKDHLVGGVLTEADIRLYVTIVGAYNDTQLQCH